MISGFIDLRPVVSGGDGGGITWPHATYSGDEIINVKYYADRTHTVLVREVDITWGSGVPVSISDHNVSSGATTIKTIVWSGGKFVGLE